MKPEVISLLDICRSGSKALGPGLRYVIWVQGCPFGCKGCITPEGRNIAFGKIATIESLVKDIAGQKQQSGLTISGGEPFLQSSSVLEMLRQLKELRPEINVIIFTGYRLEELNWPEAKNILSIIDVLIDGRYEDGKNDGIGLRGSSNQRIYFLTNRLAEYKNELESGKRNVEMHIRGEYAEIIGIPLKSKIV